MTKPKAQPVEERPPPKPEYDNGPACWYWPPHIERAFLRGEIDWEGNPI